jgi:hypothetical protein
MLSLNLHSASGIAVQRGAKSGGNLPQPFLCLAAVIRPIWRKFRISISDHRQNFGNCFSPALNAPTGIGENTAEPFALAREHSLRVR